MKDSIYKKALLPIIAVIAISISFITCDDKKGISKQHDPNIPVHAFSFQPDSGRIRDQFLINGKNFGNDPSLVKVFFNEIDEALVLGCSDEQILVLVPRTTEGRVEVSLQVGSQPKITLPSRFLYKTSRQVTTVTGSGENINDFDHGILDRGKLNPVYIGIDADNNIFVTVGDAPGPDGTTIMDRLVLINEEENLIRTILTYDQGFTHRCPPNIHPVTGWVLLGHESVRDRFLMLDPKSNWAPTLCFIKSWDEGPVGMWDGNGRMTETGEPRSKYQEPILPDIHHYSMLYCEYDSFYYTRYGRAGNNGQIVRINPDTWNAEIIGMTPPGATYGMAFNTYRDPNDPTDRDKGKTWELWMAYAGDDNGASADVQHSICTLDIRDRQTWQEAHGNIGHPLGGTGDQYYGIMSSFKRMTAQGRGHRDGLLEQAQFAGPRQMSFDKSGILYVGDSYNHCIRKIDTRTGIVSNYVGIPGVNTPFADGNEKDATFREVHGIVSIETANDYLIYASDWGNRRIRKIAEE